MTRGTAPLLLEADTGLLAGKPPSTAQNLSSLEERLAKAGKPVFLPWERLEVKGSCYCDRAAPVRVSAPNPC